MEDKGHRVWGAIWEINVENLPDLDRQEGVHNQVYKPLVLPICTPSGDVLDCRIYQLVNNPVKHEGTEDDRPFERQPSKTYMNIIIRGAKESELPADYVEMLESIKHNGNSGDPHFEIDLAVQDKLP